MKKMFWGIILCFIGLVSCNNEAEPVETTTKIEVEPEYIPPPVNEAVIKGIDKWVEKIDSELEYYQRKDRQVRPGMPCTSVHYFLDGTIVKADVDCDDSTKIKVSWEYYFRDRQELVYAWERSEQIVPGQKETEKTDQRIYFQQNEIIKAVNGEGEDLVITGYLKETVFKNMNMFR